MYAIRGIERSGTRIATTKAASAKAAKSSHEFTRRIGKRLQGQHQIKLGGIAFDTHLEPDPDQSSGIIKNKARSSLINPFPKPLPKFFAASFSMVSRNFCRSLWTLIRTAFSLIPSCSPISG